MNLVRNLFHSALEYHNKLLLHCEEYHSQFAVNFIRLPSKLLDFFVPIGPLYHNMHNEGHPQLCAIMTAVFRLLKVENAMCP